MSLLLVAILSLVPGLGHWVLGKRGKAAALFVMDFGFVCALFVLKSNAGHLLILLGYLMTMVPAALETHAIARGKVSRFSESRLYITAMLLKEGFSALPLLWRSPVFPRRTKIAWSVAVPLLAVLYFSFLWFFGIRFLNDARF